MLPVRRICVIFCIIIYLTDFVLSQYNNPFGEGLSGLDVSFLHEIAVALDPSLQSRQASIPGTWNQNQAGTPASAPATVPSLGSTGIAPTCSGKDGFFPDYSQNCRVYYRCSPSGRMARFECPMNFVFSEHLKKCDSPERVTCTTSKPVAVSEPVAAQPAPPIQTRSILPESSILGGGLWPAGLPPVAIEGASGFYEPLLSAASERPHLLLDGLPSLPTVKIMGEPRAPLDMDPDLCFGRANQYIPDADTGCRGYILCPSIFGNRFQSFFCPQGMRFDTKAESCLPRTAVRCMEVERLFPLNVGTNLGGGNLFPGLLPVATPLPPGTAETVTAPGPKAPCYGKTGFVPDHLQHCRVYYYCNAEGAALNLTCPPEMIFNPNVQNCDFIQTAPECKAQLQQQQQQLPGNSNGSPSAPQKIAPETVKPIEHTESPWSNPATRLSPLRQVVPPVNNKPAMPNPAGHKARTPGLLTLSTLSHIPGPGYTHSKYNYLDNRISGYAPMSKTPPKISVFNTPTQLEGFGTPELSKFPMKTFGNAVNTGNGFAVKPSVVIPEVLVAKRIGLTIPGSAVTVYETECDGTLNYYIEPDSACRIYHYCHTNLTMETFSCPPTEIFLLANKGCVPIGAAVCVDSLSGDAREILHKNWEATTLAPSVPPTLPFPQGVGDPFSSTVPFPMAQPGTSPKPGIAAAPEPQCVPGMTGLHGDASANCLKYYECHIDGSMITHSCPINLKFNNILKACDWPEYLDAQCNEIRPLSVPQQSV
ncbi:uncharacterized protein LOC129588613 [Paramacrobiotus metropolitanus]|uniref:uncharacterized protein LOC129588613 n=1 Tax=Paramacrobiotus metropolitanus TaxID=2943436 RepID=UPI002445A588|nr:uncharacterized protein LOC129588613 [Paramacrobiotus metropolitanus]